VEKCWWYHGFVVHVKSQAIAAAPAGNSGGVCAGYTAFIELGRPASPGFQTLPFEVGNGPQRLFASEAHACWGGFLAAVRAINDATAASC
jgi:hypothetical protein